MRFIAPLLFGLIGCAILISLGTWQVQRLAWKEGILAEIEARIDGAPQPLPTEVSPSAQRYQPVELGGAIGDGEVHVLVSTKSQGAGYRIIAPFTTEDGRTILLDRGYVPNEAKSAERRTGPATITGNLHWPDDRTSSTPANDEAGNTWFARDIGPMAEALQTEPLLVIARAEDPPAPGIQPLPVSITGIPNDHLQYAITWFSLAAIWAAMTVFYIARTRKTAKGPAT
ncbi:surfeit locus 1 family protein [Roseivivax lentus]|uniref:SURF1-like protein n=1 Tax=Roseivivax lentus TaxID=633194 RepID=A0A1N7NIF0_9RHOB|nr:SURF1 family protein [Roseivivax lentus]SIS98070.1 surfeit locus 1 family protein [Roseivivax lentus]